MAILGVGPSETYTTIAAAIAAATSVDIIELRADIVESVTLSKNIAGFRSDSTVRTWSATGSGGSHTLTINNTVTQPWTMDCLIFDHTSGNASTLNFAGFGSGYALVVSNCTFKHTSSSGQDYIRTFTNAPAADTVVFNRCDFNGSEDDFITFGAQTTVNGWTFKNCIFRNHIGSGKALIFPLSSANSVCKVYNCTFDNNGTAFEIGARGDFKNNVFTGNTADLNLTGVSDKADFVTNAFEVQTDTGGFGSGNLFGIVRADQYVNPGTDFHVKDADADIFDTGTTIVEVAVDFVGITRPQSVAYDIGAYELVVAPPAPSGMDPRRRQLSPPASIGIF